MGAVQKTEKIVNEVVEIPAKASRLNGRPTRAEAAHRHEELLVRALEMMAGHEIAAA